MEKKQKINFENLYDEMLDKFDKKFITKGIGRK